MRLWRDAKNTFFFSSRARKTLTPRFTDFFTDFEKKKKRLFWSLISI